MKRYTLEMLDDGYGTKDPCMLLDARGEYVKYRKARKLKKKCDRLAAEAVEYKRRLDAVVKMLEVPSESSKPDGWLAYCENCWWRGEAEDANWGTDPDSDGYCPSCGYEILEMGGDWSREQSIHARAVAIAEGRDNG